MEQQAMTSARIDALVASAFNLAAADEPALRQRYPSGMSPAIAAGLQRWERESWVENYAARMRDGRLKQHEPLLYGAQDVEAALAQLNRGF